MSSTINANASNGAPQETEPLLGRPGDATQGADEPLYKNLILGTGLLAQFGAVLLVALVWASVFIHPLVPLFSPHPLLQSLGVLVVVEAALVLQPTASPKAKTAGTWVHAALQTLSFAIFAAGVGIIEANKIKSGSPHFHSVHGYLGVITFAAVGVQYLFGASIWTFQRVWGSEARAKSLYKYHRVVGYVGLLLLMATILSATFTDYVVNVLSIPVWSVALVVILIVIGVFPRIKKQKLGLGA